MELENLEIYQLACVISKEAWLIYEKLDWHTKKIMGDQWIEAIDSIGGNVAEGFGRFHYLDKNRFNYNARGSLLESIHWTTLLHQRKRIAPAAYDILVNELRQLHHQLNTYIKSTKAQTNNHSITNYPITKPKGFSLLEVIIAITISSLVALMLGELTVQGYRNYRVTADQTTQVAIARRAQESVVRELREAVVSDRGDYPIIKAETNRLEFYSDVDRDAARERIRLWRDGALFIRGTTEPSGDPPRYNDRDEVTRTVARALTGEAPLFRYYGNNGAELSPPLDHTKVVLIGIAFTIDVAPGKLPRPAEVATTVQLRNIKASLEE